MPHTPYNSLYSDHPSTIFFTYQDLLDYIERLLHKYDTLKHVYPKEEYYRCIHTTIIQLEEFFKNIPQEEKDAGFVCSKEDIRSIESNIHNDLQNDFQIVDILLSVFSQRVVPHTPHTLHYVYIYRATRKLRFVLNELAHLK